MCLPLLTSQNAFHECSLVCGLGFRFGFGFGFRVWVRQAQSGPEAAGVNLTSIVKFPSPEQ